MHITGSKRHRPSVADGNAFVGLGSQQRDRLDRLATIITVQAGRRLAVQGEPGREFGVILDGEAVVEIDGREVGRLRAGDHYGELALLDPPGRSPGRRASVTAVRETTIAAMSVREFDAALHENPEAATRIMRSALELAAAAT